MEQELPKSLEEALARIRELEAGMSQLRHDISSLVSPAMLMADRLCGHTDPRVVRLATSVVRMVESVSDRLRENRNLVPAHQDIAA